MIAETFGQTDEQQTPEFRDLIFEKTGGNPFFVEEVLRSLVEQGVIFRTEKGWERKAISGIEVPPTVKAVIEQRLGRLDEETLTVLTAASVLGKEFSFELLQKVTGIGDEDVLLERIEKLLKSRFLSEKKLAQTIYAFTELQVRDVLHEGMSLVRRRRYHLKAAQMIDELYKDKIGDGEQVSELAYHFVEGNDMQKSILYCMLAGDRATKVFAHEEAARQYKIALELMDEKGVDASRRSEVLERLGDNEFVTGKNDAALRHLGEAVGIHERGGDGRKAGDLYRKMGMVTWVGQYDFPRARGYFEKSSMFLEGYPEGEELAWIDCYTGAYYYYTGQFSKGVQMLQKALALAQKLGLYEVESLAIQMLGMSAPISEKDKLDHYLRESLEIALQHDLLFASGVAYLELADQWKVDMAKGMQIIREGREWVNKTGSLFFDVWLGSIQAEAFLYMGEAMRAREIIDGIGVYTMSISPIVRVNAYGVLGHVNMRQGDLSESEKWFKKELPALERAHDWQVLTFYYCGLGHLCIQVTMNSLS